MKRLVALLALGLAAPAHAQFIGPLGGVDSSPFGAPPDFSFIAPAAGDYATLTAATGQTITCSRASADTVMTSPTHMVSVASNHCAVDYRGLQAEYGATNYSLRSEALDNAAWTASGATVLADQCAFPDGNTSMDKVTASTAAGQVFQSVTTPSTTVFTASGWVATTSGTQSMSVGVECTATGGAVVNCGCLGAGCSSAIISVTRDCVATITATTTPQRVAATVTCTSADTHAFIEASPGPWGASSGFAGCMGGMQLENQYGWSSYISTTTTATARQLDSISFPRPATVPMAGASFSISEIAQTEFAPNANMLPSNNMAILGTSSDYMPIIQLRSSANTVSAYADTPATLSSVTYADSSKTTSTRYQMHTVGGATSFLCVNGACNAGVALGAQPANPATIYIGNQHLNIVNMTGWVSQLAMCAGNPGGACAP